MADGGGHWANAPALPHDVGLEQALIGAVVVDRSGRAWRAARHLSPEAFALLAHAAIWRALPGCVVGDAIDAKLAASAANHLAALHPEAPQALVEATDATGTAIAAGNYAAQLADLHARRMLIGLLSEVPDRPLPEIAAEVASICAPLVSGVGDLCGEIEVESVFLLETAGNPPPVRWFARGWIPESESTLMAGAGAGGKSMLALMLQASLAAGKPWLGFTLPAGPSLGLYSEDSRIVVANRLAAIGAYLGVTVPDLIAGGMHVFPRPTGDLALVRQSRDGGLVTTDALARLRATVARIGPKLLILDNIGDFLPLLPYDNGGIREARRVALDPITAEGVTILGLQNVTLTGLRATDEAHGSSGGLAWRDAFQARLILERAKFGDDGDDASDRRTLHNGKVNWGASGGRIDLHWQDEEPAGVWVRDDGGEGGVVERIEQNAAERWFLDQVRAIATAGQRYATEHNSPYCVPKIVSKLRERPRRTGQKACKTLWEQLTARQEIKLVPGRCPHTRKPVTRIGEVSGVHIND